MLLFMTLCFAVFLCIAFCASVLIAAAYHFGSGFGSLLRALGNRRSNAETDNIEACRDLSGRRLRHVHDEKAVNEWLAQSEERKEEAARRRRAKLERDIAPPKHTFDRHSLAIELQEQAMSVSAAVGTAITKKTVDEMYPPNVGGSGKKNVATKGDTPHKPAAGNAARRTASARRGVALKDEWDSETTDDAATDDEELAAKRRKHMDAVEARLQKIKAAHAAAATAPSTKKGEDKGTTDAQKEHKKDKEEDDDERKEQGKEEAKQRSNADEEDKEEDDDGESSD
ncbi:hypothetical protein PTSG_03553 [Salpingoeca rosetta]|uniref:SDE2-like domain-containing protein n=1 Tax=Salpingoeca rosetta (strain ATCC 50818 / BSB-021) TaxID=946362 RepID=F2U5X9_SALR5|nr:uncharacterized protein PTSG_03553 [Salpingoeca rosetta]EGD82920.1 hypothetical protein PTSG_03553 [Salpingoeca rosetta]|eukprot:XP_004995284.1 hypothetical protein PTSG_03553 [Salpingoeca rosetta]